MMAHVRLLFLCLLYFPNECQNNYKNVTCSFFSNLSSSSKNNKLFFSSISYFSIATDNIIQGIVFFLLGDKKNNRICHLYKTYIINSRKVIRLDRNISVFFLSLSLCFNIVIKKNLT